MIGYLYWEQGIKLMYAISAVLAFIGTVNVYVDFSIDSNETGKNALKWYGVSFLLFIVAFCLSVIYNTFLK
ncbi:DUF4134 family protein [Prevotella intermedia]|uniref:Uncharacterized protein n=1 Tax=Prevotella intermedia TaxID=28131 RepID=A0A2G9ICT2_PREIN|nr:hypothetical protein CUC04_09410 [Prevotella intermedia]